MAASDMNGLRKWKFTPSGESAVLLEDTDFWIEHLVELGGSDGLQQFPSVVLRDIWEHADFAVAQGLPRRKYTEDRIKELQELKGKQGTLVIDEGTTEVQTYPSITLLEFDSTQETNDLFTYEMTFGYPQASTGAGGGGVMLASRLEFGSESDEDRLFIDSKNMVLELSQDGDRTQFKEVFRAAPIRVQGSLPLKNISVLGVIDNNVPAFWGVTGDSNAGALYRPNKLLDYSGPNFFRSGSGALPRWVRFNRGDFGLFAPAKYSITPQNVNDAPATWQLQGSDTDVWTSPTVLDTQTGLTTGWTSGEAREFEISSAQNFKYLRLYITAVADGGNVLEIKKFNLYPYSSAVLDDQHTANHGKRFLVTDRVRAINWGQVGRSRQLRINGDSLFGGSELTAHLQSVDIEDIEGLENPGFRLNFVYGYGS